MNPLLCVGLVVSLLLMIILFSKWTGSNKSDVSPSVEARVHALVKEGSRYCATADQDSNSLMAILHTTYGHAYLEASKLVLGKAAHSSAFSHLGELAQSAKTKQENAIRHLNSQHHVLPESDAVSSTGWII